MQVCCRSFYRPECDKKWAIVGNARHGLKAGGVPSRVLLCSMAGNPGRPLQAGGLSHSPRGSSDPLQTLLGLVAGYCVYAGFDGVAGMVQGAVVVGFKGLLDIWWLDQTKTSDIGTPIFLSVGYATPCSKR